MLLVTGDIFALESEALGHGVNCKGVMGAGVARGFRERFPAMHEAYRALCKGGELQPGGVFPWREEASGLWVYNMASQNLPGPVARLSWLRGAAEATLEHASAQGVELVTIPLIGCGIGGLEWEDVAEVLEEVEASFTAKFRVVKFE